MSKLKILVTGANGYLGRGIVKQLVDNGHDVIAVDFSVDAVDLRAERIACNMFEEDNPFFEFGEPDVLLHLAWKDGFVHYSDAHIDYLPKHYRFLQSMMESGIKRIAVMGSMHEVGFFEGSISEETPCRPITPYGIGKNALRELTQMLSLKNNVPIQWLRGYYIVGNTEVGNSIFSKIVSSASRGEKTFPFTMGQNQYDFVDYELFCEMVAAAVGQEEVLGVINISSGRPEKLADRVERFIKENEFDIKLQYGAFQDRPYDSKAIWGNNDKIQKILSDKKYLA